MVKGWTMNENAYLNREIRDPQYRDGQVGGRRDDLRCWLTPAGQDHVDVRRDPLDSARGCAPARILVPVTLVGVLTSPPGAQRAHPRTRDPAAMSCHREGDRDAGGGGQHPMGVAAMVIVANMFTGTVIGGEAGSCRSLCRARSGGNHDPNG